MVTHVVAVCAERPREVLAALLGDSGRFFSYVPIIEASPDPALLRRAVLAVEAALGAGPAQTVYLHCWLGRHRSAAVAAGLLVRQGLFKTFSQAHGFLRERRPEVQPIELGEAFAVMIQVLANDMDFRFPARGGATLVGDLLK